MLRLNLKKDPYWIDLAPGIRVQVRPATTALLEAARASIQNGTDTPHTALLMGLAAQAIIAWEGVGDVEGNVVEPSPQYIEALMANWPLSNAFDEKYLRPAILLEQEKNG